jgi:hypothetical protein
MGVALGVKGRGVGMPDRGSREQRTLGVVDVIVNLRPRLRGSCGNARIPLGVVVKPHARPDRGGDRRRASCHAVALQSEPNYAVLSGSPAVKTA